MYMHRSNKLLFPPAKELNVKNIVNVLHEAKFSDGDWELLGLQLIEHTDLTTIEAKRHGKPGLCMMDMISQWLKTESQPSWDKLAEAVQKVEGYGEATAEVVCQKAEIGKTEFVLKVENMHCVLYIKHQGFITGSVQLDPIWFLHPPSG